MKVEASERMRRMWERWAPLTGGEDWRTFLSLKMPMAHCFYDGCMNRATFYRNFAALRWIKDGKSELVLKQISNIGYGTLSNTLLVCYF